MTAKTQNPTALAALQAASALIDDLMGQLELGYREESANHHYGDRSCSTCRTLKVAGRVQHRLADAIAQAQRQAEGLTVERAAQKRVQRLQRRLTRRPSALITAEDAVAALRQEAALLARSMEGATEADLLQLILAIALQQQAGTYRSPLEGLALEDRLNARLIATASAPSVPQAR